jgi:anti-sigma regulatory factor (Ser/Thr protein kinase)
MMSSHTVLFDNLWDRKPDLAEDAVWDEVKKSLPSLGENLRHIVAYGVNEMVNNAIDHSRATWIGVQVTQENGTLGIRVTDNGVGIFRNIREGLGLDDERHAIFELTKGKVTTDPSRHTGEGIFFTSRMFDSFFIVSHELSLMSGSNESWSEGKASDVEDRLFEEPGDDFEGTGILMKIALASTRTTAEVFSRFIDDEIGFSRTRIFVQLGADAADGHLVSRSQARRIMARADLFKEVVLDFGNVKSVTPAFADEIFRVFQKEHPAITISALNANESVAAMVAKAQRALRDSQNPTA